MTNIVYLTRRESFCSAHRLNNPTMTAEENREIFGKCNYTNGHGHNYILYVTVKGEPDPKTGMVMNLTELKKIIHTHVKAKVDHYNLNIDVPEFKDILPTAENLAIQIWNWIEPNLPNGLLHEVRLEETENNSVSYKGPSS